MKVVEYLTADGRCPYRDWLDDLDIATRARVQRRVWRFRSNQLGDHKGVGAGVSEARLAFGPGYRVYFGRHGPARLVLLLGGDKSSQARDILKAKRFWRDYLEANAHDETLP